MGAFFVYIVKSSLCLALFFLFYRLLLSKDTFHRFNRIGLLCLVLLSVIIPFCRVTVQEPIVMQPAVMDLETLLLMASLMGKQTMETIPFWVQLILWMYIGGVCFFFCQFAYSCMHIVRIIRKGTISRLDNGVRLVITPEAVTPFSWMRYIIVSQKDMEESGQEILSHEMAHIRLRHSLDLLISEGCILFHWFNPAAWLIRQELQNIHEYEADESVLTQGIDAKKYQLLLIKKAVGSQRFTSMANSLNHSSLKKRITMMLKRKSNPWAKLKYVCVLPLAALAVVSFARPEIVRELDKISNVKFSEIVPVKEIPAVKNVEKPVAVPDTVRVHTQVQAPVVANVPPVAPEDVLIERDILINVNPDFNLDFSKMQIRALPENFDEMTFDFEFTPEMMASLKQLENLQIDTAQMRKIQMDFQFNMDQNREAWEKHKEIIKEQAKAYAKIDKEQMKALQEQMKEQQKIMAKVQVDIQKAVAAKQKVAAIIPADAYVLIDGKEATTEQMNALDPATIQSMSVFKDKTATDKYGEKGKNGVIEIITK